MILAHLSQSLRETFPTRASEWALGTILFFWAIILAARPALFADNPTFAELARLADQQTWMVLCLVAGGGRLIVLAVNGAWRRSPHARAASAFIACFVWFQISIGLYQVGASTGLAVYPVLFALDVFNVIRAMGEAGLSDRFHQRAAKDGSDE